MHIIHVIPGIEEEASGPSYSVPALNRALNRAGVASRLLATGAPRTDAAAGLRIFPRRHFPSRLGRSPEMYRWLRNEVASKAVAIVHDHSIWMMPNVYPGWVTLGGKAQLVVSPRGTLSEWALGRSRAVKLVFWAALQKRAIAHAALFHATAESECLDIRRLGFRQPIALVPNGVDIPEIAAAHRGDARTLLFLGRVHPKKGVDLLLEAWTRLQAAHPSWTLRIVGPGEAGYLRKLGGLAASLGAERVTFAGPLYGRDKNEAYRSADLFVLPTHSENFGMAVAEALAAGCPVVTTRGAPWSGLVAHGAGWWVDIGVEPLRTALEEAMVKEPHALTEMGARGRAWMERQFSWERIAAQMLESYRWIREGGARPAWVHND
jgi:glycosyltransferase involved in cell wall biosynthesis